MKIYHFAFLLTLASCGTMGIGSNHTVNVFNDSEDTIMAIGERGTQRISAGESVQVTSRRTVQIVSKNRSCDSPNIVTEINTPALVFNIVPGILAFGIIPIFVDAVTGNLTRLPENFVFECT